jgi:hypothetical protein
MHRHLKPEHLAFGLILLEEVPTSEYLLDIDAEVRSSGNSSFLRRVENSGFFAGAIKAATRDGISKT